MVTSAHSIWDHGALLHKNLILLADGARQTGVYVVDFIRISPRGTFLAQGVLIVPTRKHKAIAHFTVLALLALVAVGVAVVTIHAFADRVVGFHTGGHHAFQTHTLLAWLAGFSEACTVRIGHTWKASEKEKWERDHQISGCLLTCVGLWRRLWWK